MGKGWSIPFAVADELGGPCEDGAGMLVLMLTVGHGITHAPTQEPIAHHPWMNSQTPLSPQTASFCLRPPRLSCGC